jgi:small redox-active disulfide protein 2
MSSEDFTQIIVAGQRTGIMGLKGVLEAAAVEFRGRPDGEIAEEMTNRLSQKNYILDKIRDAYKTAFLREYKKHVGEPFEDEASGILQVKVLGPGCPNCERLEQEIMAVMAEMRLPVDFEHVRDPLEISHYGMVAVPGLVVDNQVVASGRVPTKDQMKAWLGEAAERKNIR